MESSQILLCYSFIRVRLFPIKTALPSPWPHGRQAEKKLGLTSSQPKGRKKIKHFFIELWCRSTLMTWLNTSFLAFSMTKVLYETGTWKLALKHQNLVVKCRGLAFKKFNQGRSDKAHAHLRLGPYLFIMIRVTISIHVCSFCWQILDCLSWLNWQCLFISLQKKTVEMLKVGKRLNLLGRVVQYNHENSSRIGQLVTHKLGLRGVLGSNLGGGEKIDNLHLFWMLK